MAITYTLAKIILDGMLQQAERAYLESLQNQLREVQMLYERGEMSRENYEKLSEKLAETIKNVQAQQRTRPSGSYDVQLGSL